MTGHLKQITDFETGTQTHSFWNNFFFLKDKTKMEMSGHKTQFHFGWNHTLHINLRPAFKQYDVGLRILACFPQEWAINPIMNSSPLAKDSRVKCETIWLVSQFKVIQQFHGRKEWHCCILVKVTSSNSSCLDLTRAMHDPRQTKETLRARAKIPQQWSERLRLHYCELLLNVVLLSI